MALATEIQEATQSVLEQTNLVRSTSFAPAQANSSSAFFLQLTVNDIGVRVPLTPSYSVSFTSRLGHQSSRSILQSHIRFKIHFIEPSSYFNVIHL